MTVNIGGKHVKRGEQEVTEKKKAEENGDDKVAPSLYSCEVVLKNTTLEKADDKRIARSHHKRLKALEKNSHPEADWVCLKCGCKARKVEKPKKRRKRLIKKEK